MEMQGCLWAWKIPWGISGLSLTKSNQGMKRRKNKAKKKTNPESGCRQDLHIPSALTLWAVNAKQAFGPRYLGAGKHIPPLSLSAQGNSWLQQEPTRQILPIFRDICISLLLEEEVLARQNWFCRRLWVTLALQNPLQQSISWWMLSLECDFLKDKALGTHFLLICSGIRATNSLSHHH